MSKRPRTDASEENRERRSKFRHDPSIQEEREEGSSSQWHTSMQMRQVMSGRRILFNFLEEIEVKLGDYIEDQGWIYFCSLNVPIYPTLVRRFYENLKIKDDCIESFVKGKKIVITEELLGSLFQMPHTGSKFLELEDKGRALEAIGAATTLKETLLLAPYH